MVSALICLVPCAGAQAETIPGILPVDVYLSLESKGFTTDKRFKSEGSQFMSDLENEAGRFSGQVYCPPGQSAQINVVVGLVQNFSSDANATNAMSANFLTFIASLPYEGSKPGEAQAWVMANLGKETEKMFGPVKFQLFKEERTRMLRLSMEPMKEEAARPSALPAIKHVDPASRVKSAKIPEVGETFLDVQFEHGNPVIKDPDTGWATWPTFKVQFKDGKAVEVQRRTPGA